jgi:leader peptidase (prepilin peptidase)/N-methyltransferase
MFGPEASGMSRYIIEFMVFFFGICVGSFMNVCIFRLPDPARSIVRPRSMCPNCNTTIPFYDNIPILSYILLGRSCRFCKTPIPMRYPLVELLGGLFALGALLRFGPTIAGLVNYLFISVLLVVAFIDLDHRIIPDRITLPGIPIFFAVSLLQPAVSWIDALLGILIGGGILFGIGWLYYRITQKEGMGGGDIKLLAMIGAFTGWQGVCFTIFVASGVGTLAGIVFMLVQHQGMKLAIPFGPFLSIGAILYIFYGTDMMIWYLNLLR